MYVPDPWSLAGWNSNWLDCRTHQWAIYKCAEKESVLYKGKKKEKERWNEGYSEISCREESEWDVGLLRQLEVGREKDKNWIMELKKSEKTEKRDTKMFHHYACRGAAGDYVWLKWHFMNMGNESLKVETSFERNYIHTIKLSLDKA